MEMNLADIKVNIPKDWIMHRNKTVLDLDVVDWAKHLMSMQIDMELYVPELGEKLQRTLCWTELKKVAYINAILKGIQFPAIQAIRMDKRPHGRDKKSVWEIIDGKHRLTTLKEFVSGELIVPIEINGTMFSVNFTEMSKKNQQYFKEMLDATQQCHFLVYVGSKLDSPELPWRFKREWIDSVMFSGEPAELEHREKMYRVK